MMQQSNTHIFSIFLLLSLLLLTLYYVRGQHNTPSTHNSQPIVITRDPTPLYSTYTTTSSDPVGELNDRFGTKRLPVILEINRIDKEHLEKGATLVIPPSNSTMLSLSPFPNTLATAHSVHKLLLVSQRIQAFGAYENGQLVRWGAVSSGKIAAPTENGLYFANWKGKEVISTVDDEWTLLWDVNIDNTGGVSIHQYGIPGYPASHSCVRLFAADAKWFYDWTDQWILSKDGKKKLANGTPIIIFSNYDFEDISAPWEKLPTEPLASKVIKSRLDNALSQYIPTILEEAQKRESLLKQHTN